MTNSSRSDSNAALGRLVASENSASDLLAVLAELDDRPLATVFDLPTNDRYNVTREFTIGGGRLDLLITNESTGQPAALVEMKGAASLHGNQLERYLRWSLEFEKQPTLYLCTFDSGEFPAGEEWRPLSLFELFSAWNGSVHVHAAWLAGEVTRLLEAWHREADGPLGERTGHYVTDIATRRMARQLHARLSTMTGRTSEAFAARDSGGNAMLVARTTHPIDPADESVSVGVDLRSTGRRSTSNIWKFRPHVNVKVSDMRDLQSSRILAFDLAKELQPALALSSLRNELGLRIDGRIIDSLSASRHDGFRQPLRDFDFDLWADRLQNDPRNPTGGFFGNDAGLRLSSILDLDVSDLTRHDVEELVEATVDILQSAASLH